MTGLWTRLPINDVTDTMRGKDRFQTIIHLHWYGEEDEEAINHHHCRSAGGEDDEDFNIIIRSLFAWFLQNQLVRLLVRLLWENKMLAALVNCTMMTKRSSQAAAENDHHGGVVLWSGWGGRTRNTKLDSIQIRRITCPFTTEINKDTRWVDLFESQDEDTMRKFRM